MHASQVPDVSQGSGPPPQSLAYQFQSEHEPLLGPLLLPVAHDPELAHQPQLPIAVQLSQLEAPVAHGSAGVQSLAYQRHWEHDPEVGPPTQMAVLTRARQEAAA